MVEKTEKIKTAVESTTDSADKRTHEFFSDIVTKLNVTEFLYNIKGLSEREYQMWSAAINKNLEPMMFSSRIATNVMCANKAFEQFMLALRMEKNVKLRKLAVDISRSKLFVWAEVEDDDETSMRSILYADSVANLKMEDLGFSVSATVVEKSDCVPVPSHYVKVIDNGTK
jgi:hypothetical protein